LYLPIASNISVAGRFPASLSLVAFTITITRIVLSPLFPAATAAVLRMRRTSVGRIDIRPNSFRKKNIEGLTCLDGQVPVSKMVAGFGS
jgi:hypothetical protein